MKINHITQKLFKRLSIFLAKSWISNTKVLIITMPLFISNLSFAGRVSDGGGTGCRQIVMQAAHEVAKKINENKNLFESESNSLDGDKFLSYIDANNIFSISMNEQEYIITYGDKKYLVQCEALEFQSSDEIEALTAKAVFKRIKEETTHDYSEYIGLIGLIKPLSYLNPNQDATNIARNYGYNQVTNRCQLHIPLGQGAHGDLDMFVHEFQNSKRQKFSTAYFIIKEAGQWEDYIEIAPMSIKDTLKSENDITKNTELHHASSIEILKLNKRTHTYKFIYSSYTDQDDDASTIECENPLE